MLCIYSRNYITGVLNFTTRSMIESSLLYLSLNSILIDIFYLFSASHAESLRPMSHLRFHRTILLRDFVVQLYRATNRKCDVACRATTQWSCFADYKSTILCNFVAKMRGTLIGQFLFMRQSCSVQHGMSHLRFCRPITLRDKIAR